MSAERIHFVETAGLRLRALVRGKEAGRAALVLHGFTGSAESMQGVAQALEETRPTARLELVGHGESDAPSEVAPYAMSACVEQVVGSLAPLGLERPHLVGYSMGGRTALSAAVAYPDRFASLTLVGATAGIDDAALRSERIDADQALADRIERDGLEAFVDHWMALPLFASQASLGAAALARARAERLRQRPHGLANSLRGMGAGAQPPIFDRLGACALPVLLVVGGGDEKFKGIAARLASALPDARTAVVEGVGHAAHLEDPIAFGEILRGFLASVEEATDSRSAIPRPEGGQDE